MSESKSVIRIILDVINKDGGKIKDASNDLKKLKDSSDQGSSSIKTLGASFSSAAMLMAQFAAAAASIALPVIAAATFERKMAEVKAVTGATTEQFKEMEITSKELGRNTEFSATQAAEGLKFLGMAGLNAEQSIKAIGPALDLALVGGIELADSADYITNIMGGMNLKVEDLSRIVDVLANTSTKSNSTVNELAEGMKYAAPAAAAMGVSVEEAAAAMGVLHDNGIKGGQAGTAMRAILSRLAGGSKEVKEGFAALNTEIVKNNDGSLNLTATMANLEKSGMGLAEANKIFGQEAGTAAIAMASQAEKVASLTAANEAAAGKAQEMATIINDNVTGAWRNLQSAVSGFMITVGTELLPLFKQLIDYTTSVVNSVTDLLEEYNVLGEGLNLLSDIFVRLYNTVAESWFGDLVKGSLDLIVESVKGLYAMLESGQMEVYLNAWIDQWKTWGEDVEKSIIIVKAAITDLADYFGIEMDNMEGDGKDLVDFLIKAFNEFPTNIKTMVGILTVEIAAAFDKIKADAVAFKDGVKAIFNNTTFEEVAERNKKAYEQIETARIASIDAILAEHDTVINKTNEQIAAADRLRKKYNEAAADRAASAELQRKVDEATATAADEVGAAADRAATSIGNVAAAGADAATSLNNVDVTSGNATTSLNNAATASGNATTSINNVATASGNATTPINNVDVASSNAATSLSNAATASGNAAVGFDNAGEAAAIAAKAISDYNAAAAAAKSSNAPSVKDGQYQAIHPDYSKIYPSKDKKEAKRYPSSSSSSNRSRSYDYEYSGGKREDSYSPSPSSSKGGTFTFITKLTPQQAAGAGALSDKKWEELSEENKELLKEKAIEKAEKANTLTYSNGSKNLFGGGSNNKGFLSPSYNQNFLDAEVLLANQRADDLLLKMRRVDETKSEYEKLEAESIARRKFNRSEEGKANRFYAGLTREQWDELSEENKKELDRQLKESYKGKDYFNSLTRFPGQLTAEQFQSSGQGLYQRQKAEEEKAAQKAAAEAEAALKEAEKQKAWADVRKRQKESEERFIASEAKAAEERKASGFGYYSKFKTTKPLDQVEPVEPIKTIDAKTNNLTTALSRIQQQPKAGDAFNVCGQVGNLTAAIKTLATNISNMTNGFGKNSATVHKLDLTINGKQYESLQGSSLGINDLINDLTLAKMRS